MRVACQWDVIPAKPLGLGGDAGVGPIPEVVTFAPQGSTSRYLSRGALGLREGGIVLCISQYRVPDWQRFSTREVSPDVEYPHHSFARILSIS